MDSASSVGLAWENTDTVRRVEREDTHNGWRYWLFQMKLLGIVCWEKSYVGRDLGKTLILHS